MDGMRIRSWTNSILVLLATMALAGGAHAQDGKTPYGSLIRATDGYLYGTTAFGGTYANGTVFRMDHAGGVTVLHSFHASDEGSSPNAKLLESPLDGYLYGTCSHNGGSGDNGTVWKIKKDGTDFHLLHTFSGTDGSQVQHDAGLVSNGDGYYYGTIWGGPSSKGFVYKVDASGRFLTVHTFAGGASDGANPSGGLINVSGTYYGTTAYGGASNQGTVYQMAPGGAVTVLYSFTSSNSNPNGTIPCCTLFQASDTFLYGSCRYGGVPGYGTLFRVTTTGSFTLIHPMQGTDGSTMLSALMQSPAGLIYGTAFMGGANNMGVVFRFDPNVAGYDYRVLHDFSNWDSGGYNAEGLKPESELTLADDGLYYGICSGGGVGGAGTIYSIDAAGNLGPHNVL
jgi:uncharacterized repeat protein (TIGR03803 family)